VRNALAEVLQKDHSIELVGQSGDVDQVLRDVGQMNPKVVLIEVKRKDGMGLEILRQLSNMPEPPRLIVLTSYPTTWEQDSASRAGAEAYLLKDLDTSELISIIHEQTNLS
jgi:DNA-binding NarL/FixJ family response regulator